MGTAKHEDVSAGSSDFTLSGGGVWRRARSDSCHQKYEEMPEFPRKCPLFKSGKYWDFDSLMQLHSHLNVV